MTAPARLFAPLLAVALAVPALPAVVEADWDGDGRHGWSQRFDGHRGHDRDRFGHGPRRDLRHDRQHWGDRHRDRPEVRRYPYAFHDHRRDGRHPVHRPLFFAPGHWLPVLPGSYLRIVLGDDLFFYGEGVYFRPYRSGYVVVGAPIGARVRHLPAGSVAFVLGPRRYFHVNATYYLWDDRDAAYVVVDKPRGADAAVADALAERDAPFIDPAEGGGDAFRDLDRTSCRAWALAEAGAPDGAAYRRAYGACLAGRESTDR